MIETCFEFRNILKITDGLNIFLISMDPQAKGRITIRQNFAEIVQKMMNQEASSYMIERT